MMTREQYEEMNSLYTKRFQEIEDAKGIIRELEAEIHRRFLALSAEYESKVSEYYEGTK